MDIAAWLKELGLDRYAEAFRENAIDEDVLPELTADDLREIGVGAVGHRRKLLRAIGELRGDAAEGGGGEAPAGTAVSGGEPGPAREKLAMAEGERRQVTVLFCDLSDYTGLSRELGAEEVHALLGRFFDRVDRIVENHGGRIDKHIGDCAMAVFGAPVSHGNDAERAVRAALSTRRAMAALSSELGRSVRVHTGVASGQVVASGTGSASHREY